jgi:demethylspheroidene O-methyltransferase
MPAMERLAAEPAISAGDIAGTLPLAARFRRWRNRIIADPRFQQACLRIPGLRFMARRKADALYRLTAGFVYSQILHAALESGLLSALNGEPLRAPALERLTGLPQDAMRRLLSSAKSVGLVSEPAPGLYALDDIGVVAANDPGIVAMVRHHALLYADIADPLALLRKRTRETGIARLWAYSANPEPGSVDPEDARVYSELMRVSQDAVAREVIAAHDFSRHREVVDVGGGHGRFLWHVGQAAAAPRLHLFDLPPVAEQGRLILGEAGFAARLEVTGGSFFSDPVPAGADCYTLVRVLYDHDDANALTILKRVRAAMAPGSVLVIAEPMGGEDASRALVNGYFSLYLVAMASGRCRTPAEHAAMALEAGFASAVNAPVRQPLFASVVIATA